MVVAAKTPEERLAYALTRVPKAEPSEVLLKDIKDEDALVYVDTPEHTLGLDPSRHYQPDDTFQTLLWGTDEEALAQHLRDAGVGYMLLRRDVVPSVDRGRSLATRLYQDDHRSMFELRMVDHRFLLYKVLKKEREFTLEQASIASRYLRATMRGDAPPQLPDIKTGDDMKWNLIASLRRQGGRAWSTRCAPRPSSQTAWPSSPESWRSATDGRPRATASRCSTRAQTSPAGDPPDRGAPSDPDR